MWRNNAVISACDGCSCGIMQFCPAGLAVSASRCDALLLLGTPPFRCQKFTLGLACCSEASFPCIGKDKPGLDGAVTGAASIPS